MKKLFIMVLSITAVSLYAQDNTSIEEVAKDFADALYRSKYLQDKPNFGFGDRLRANNAVTQQTIAEIVAVKPEFSTLRKALETTQLTDTLNGGTEFTIFAPTNAAFSKLRKEVVDELFANPEKLKSILLYHVVPNKYAAKEVAKLKAAQTVEGEDVKFAVYNGSVKVNNANVSQADIEAKNGVIHVIDTVLVPQE